MDDEREEEVEEEGLEGTEERGDVVGEGGYLKEERDYQMMAEGDKVAPDQENSKGKKNRRSKSSGVIKSRKMTYHGLANSGLS